MPLVSYELLQPKNACVPNLRCSRYALLVRVARLFTQTAATITVVRDAITEILFDASFSTTHDRLVCVIASSPFCE